MILAEGQILLDHGFLCLAEELRFGGVDNLLVGLKLVRLAWDRLHVQVLDFFVKKLVDELAAEVLPVHMNLENLLHFVY